MFYDRAVISVDGIHPEHGLTSDNVELCAVNRAIVQQSRKTTVLADHSKFGKIGRTVIAPVARVDMIITDKAAPRQVSEGSAKVVRVQYKLPAKQSLLKNLIHTLRSSCQQIEFRIS